MGVPFEQLPTILDRYSRGTSAAASRAVQKAALAAGAEAVRATRVDTGLARSNWVARLDTAFIGEVAAYAPGHKLGKGETANAAGAMAQQRSVIGRFNIGRNKKIHITNNVPYIGYLNDGSRTTTPDMMARRAIQIAAATIRGTRILRKA
jgi:hypothetical protein